jgi:hypothetical protein
MPFPLHILKMYTSTRQISPTVCVFKMVFEQMLLMAILIKIYTMNLHILLHSDSMNLGHYLPNIQQDFKISPGYFFSVVTPTTTLLTCN